MSKFVKNHQQVGTLPEAVVNYWPTDKVLEIHNAKPLGDGEEIAQFITVFYDRDNDNENEVVAIRLDFADSLPKPFVDAILAK
jgi:hypothetical protein